MVTGLDSVGLTPLEERFRDAAYNRDDCDLRDDNTEPSSWGSERHLSANVVKSVLVRGITDGMPSDTVISLKGAVIVGDLSDLDGVSLPPLRLESCHFRGEANFDRAIFTGEARFDGSVFTCQARFAEAVFNSHARFDMVDFAYAEFYKVDIAGDAYFYDARFRGKHSADNPSSQCAHFRRARFGGDAQFRKAVFESDASFTRSRFEGDAHFGALGDEVSWQRHGERSEGAHFLQSAIFNHACFDNYAGFKKTTFAGGAEFYHAIFGGDADFYRSEFTGPAEVRFQRSRFKGNAEFRGTVLEGPAKFNNAVFDDDANFGNNEHVTGATFCDDMDFSEVRVASHANFATTHINRQSRFDYASAVRMTFKGAKFDRQAQFSAEGLKTETLCLRAASAPGRLSLKDADIVTIEDNSEVWPPERYLTGCAYRRIRADHYEADPAVSQNAMWPWTRWFRTWYDTRSATSGPDKMGVISRIEWLKGEKNSYDPYRYDQLIDAYRLAGDETKANFVALAKQRERRGSLNWPGKLWGWIQDGLAGYGYRLWLPVLWLVGLIIAGSLVFDSGVDLKPRAEFPSFESAYYTTDLLFPLVNLGHRSSFEFHDWRRWLSFAFMLLGWLLAAAVGAGLQRIWSQRA